MMNLKSSGKETIDEFLKNSKDAIDLASSKKEFLDEIRSKALAFSGEVLMSHVLNLILRIMELNQIQFHLMIGL